MQSRKRVILYSLVGLILIGLLVFAVVSSLTGDSKPTTKTAAKPSTSQKTQSDQSDDPSTTNGGNAATAQPGGAVAPAPSTGSAAAAPSTGAAAASQLSNTGPGQTLTLFGVVTIAAAMVAHTYQRRKLVI